ncbi:MAG: glycosyltransferase [Akkermansiaceae bacterium]|nr:glycosyltransferase [Akkermansiaceae bacterium]
MTVIATNGRWQTDGKFFRAGQTRVWLKAVTYGPFPPDRPALRDEDFARIAAAGFNAVRLYEMPDRAVLDAAWAHGLRVFAGLEWGQSADFIARPGVLALALDSLTAGLRETADHPALAAVYVGNEVPSDLVRWMGPTRVRHALERLIAHGRTLAPEVMFAYANYPSTEYLEPENADFSAFNIYLEHEPDYRNYLKRLHHIAGDRPLMVSEFGLDSRRNGTTTQANTLAWALRASAGLSTAGFTVYAWSDCWRNGNAEVLDWDFGLTDRQGRGKPALSSVSAGLACSPPSPADPGISFSVIVCTRNGGTRIGKCLKAISALAGGPHECWVVDDGSTDGTAELVNREFPEFNLLRLPPSGLSAARNAGAAAAGGDWLAFTDDDCEPDPEWLVRMRPLCAEGRFAAVGGPNLPPPPQSWQEAVVCAAPGAPSHVLLDDGEAEHLPGCNLVVNRRAFEMIGGFDPVFHTAGDDVDFCWRLRDAGFRLGFEAGAFVWHWRRPSVRLFLRQQLGYGRAERLLMRKHPHRFSSHGGARWDGFVYGGGPVRADGGSVIYHGAMGMAGYQAVINRTLPLRGLTTRYNHGWTRIVLHGVGFFQPRLRAWARNASFHLPAPVPPPASPASPTTELAVTTRDGRDRAWALRLLLDRGWSPGGPSDCWDLTQHGTRLQLAVEHGEGPAKTILIRVWGTTSLLPAELRQPPIPTGFHP